MINRISEDKINLTRELGYVLLLLTFFAGVIVGAFQLKNVDADSFRECEETLNEDIARMSTKEFYLHSNGMFYNGLKTIAFYWIVGMSVVGTPVLIGYLGYKGYALGYTISTIIRLLGIKAGNLFVFKYLFIENVILVLSMIFLGNISIKLSKNFFVNKQNIKLETMKYTVITGIVLMFWLVIHIAQKFILSTF